MADISKRFSNVSMVVATARDEIARACDRRIERLERPTFRPRPDRRERVNMAFSFQADRRAAAQGKQISSSR
jgi:hypothetical protein